MAKVKHLPSNEALNQIKELIKNEIDSKSIDRLVITIEGDKLEVMASYKYQAGSK
jgi:hypothetical protein